MKITIPTQLQTVCNWCETEYHPLDGKTKAGDWFQDGDLDLCPTCRQKIAPLIPQQFTKPLEEVSNILHNIWYDKKLYKNESLAEMLLRELPNYLIQQPPEPRRRPTAEIVGELMHYFVWEVTPRAVSDVTAIIDRPAQESQPCPPK